MFLKRNEKEKLILIDNPNSIKLEEKQEALFFTVDSREAVEPLSRKDLSETVLRILLGGIGGGGSLYMTIEGVFKVLEKIQESDFVLMGISVLLVLILLGLAGVGGSIALISILKVLQSRKGEKSKLHLQLHKESLTIIEEKGKKKRSKAYTRAALQHISIPTEQKSQEEIHFVIKSEEEALPTPWGTDLKQETRNYIVDLLEDMYIQGNIDVHLTPPSPPEDLSQHLIE